MDAAHSFPTIYTFFFSFQVDTSRHTTQHSFYLTQEAQSVISRRAFDARAVFEQNTSAGQMHHLRRSSLNQQSVTIPHSSPPSTAGRKASLPVWPPASSIETSHQVIRNWEKHHTSEFSSEKM
jgi:hypothetical protein